MNDRLHEAFAQEMDAGDPLAELRQEFLIPAINEQEAIYFCGHSLGLQPKRAELYVQIELRDWAKLGVEAHFRGSHP